MASPESRLADMEYRSGWEQSLTRVRDQLMIHLRHSESAQFEAQRHDRDYHQEQGIQIGLEKAVYLIDRFLDLGEPTSPYCKACGDALNPMQIAVAADVCLNCRDDPG